MREYRVGFSGLGGALAGSRRRDIKKRSGKRVVRGENFKGLAGKRKMKIV